MIKFALVCSNAHTFESWFQSDAVFEVQAAASLIACPVCSETVVTKAIMSPAITAKGRGAEPSTAPLTPILDEKAQEMRSRIEEIRRQIFAEAEDVGDHFPEEARKIHEGNVAERPIHGRASVEEARGLLEDGIVIFPIPNLPDEFN
jgi:hypothetical protein